MPDSDLDRILDMTIDAMDFQFMISDVKDFLTFSEENIAWQHRRERHAIDLQDWSADAHQERYHLEQGTDHRFQVSLPLRVRYSALIAFVTSVEWSMEYLARSLQSPVGKKKKGVNPCVHLLRDLTKRTGIDASEAIANYEALVKLRNCVAHAGGIVDSYEYKADLPSAVERIPGTTLESWHFFGPQVCFSRGALEGPIAETAELVLSLHRELREQGHLQKGTST